MKKISIEDVQRYLSFNKHRPDEDVLQLITDVANYFARGAISDLSNFLYYEISENGNELVYRTAKGCRCMSCYEWQIMDPDTNEIVHSADTLSEFV